MTAAQDTDNRPDEAAGCGAALEPQSVEGTHSAGSGDPTQAVALDPAPVIDRVEPLAIGATDSASGDAAAASVRTSGATDPRSPEASRVSETDSDWSWTAGDRRFLFAVSVLVLLLGTVEWARMSGWGRRPIEIHRLPERTYEFRVEINSATWVEWMQLDGIGEVLARRIVEDRERRGPFRSIEELARVPGLGPKTIATIRPWLDCTDCGRQSGSVADP